MSNTQVALDIAMCLLWITTYILVLIGTVKYHYPMISPITQAMIAPMEFATLVLFVKLKVFLFNYAFIAYLFWSMIEIAIIYVMVKKQFVKRRWVIPYIGLVLLVTAIMIYWVAIMEKMFFFSYFNTFIGIVFWLVFVIKHKDYPIKPITLAIFLAKLMADTLAIPIYFREGNLVTQAICILLPLCDVIFVVVFFWRKHRKIS